MDVVNRPAMRVAAIRHTGPYNTISKAFDQLGQIAGKAGLFASGGEMVALYHDDPMTVAPEKLRSDAGVTIGPSATLPAGLTEQKVDGGQFAHLRHTGSYEGLPASWKKLRDEMQAAGRTIGQSPSYEVYVNNPMDTPKEQLITDIYVRIG